MASMDFEQRKKQIDEVLDIDFINDGMNYHHRIRKIANEIIDEESTEETKIKTLRYLFFDNKTRTTFNSVMCSIDNVDRVMEILITKVVTPEELIKVRDFLVGTLKMRYCGPYKKYISLFEFDKESMEILMKVAADVYSLGDPFFKEFFCLDEKIQDKYVELYKILVEYCLINKKFVALSELRKLCRYRYECKTEPRHENHFIEVLIKLVYQDEYFDRVFEFINTFNDYLSKERICEIQYNLCPNHHDSINAENFKKTVTENKIGSKFMCHKEFLFQNILTSWYDSKNYTVMYFLKGIPGMLEGFIKLNLYIESSPEIKYCNKEYNSVNNIVREFLEQNGKSSEIVSNVFNFDGTNSDIENFILDCLVKSEDVMSCKRSMVLYRRKKVLPASKFSLELLKRCIGDEKNYDFIKFLVEFNNGLMIEDYSDFFKDLCLSCIEKKKDKFFTLLLGSDHTRRYIEKNSFEFLKKIVTSKNVEMLKSFFEHLSLVKIDHEIVKENYVLFVIATCSKDLECLKVLCQQLKFKKIKMSLDDLTRLNIIYIAESNGDEFYEKFKKMF